MTITMESEPKYIFIMPLEKIPNRYTVQWYTSIPKQLARHIKKQGKYSIFFDNAVDYSNALIGEVDYVIVNVPGAIAEQNTSTGAFINFASTNIWKTSQIERFAQMVTDGLVPKGSKVFFTDSWNPGIINVRYMSDLMGLDLEIHGFWHAGAHDPYDFLGRNANKEWAYPFERSLFGAIDVNYFATEFYKSMFTDALGIDKNSSKIILSGHPNIHLIEEITSHTKKVEEKDSNLILFPHRLAPEKQVEIFKDLAETMPEYEWVICQEKVLEKYEYHNLLSQAKIVWSAALQETFGISQVEGILANAISLSPDRLSYSEMYNDYFKYPSEWTLDWDSYIANKDKIIIRIKQIMYDYEHDQELVKEELENQKNKLIFEFLTAQIIWDKLTD